MEHISIQLVTTNNYKSPTGFRTLKITVTTAHMKCSVFTSRFLVTDPNNVLANFLNGWLNHVKVKVKATLGVEVYCQSVHLGVRPPDTIRVLAKPSESESELLYDRRFTAKQFVLATSPLRLTTRIFFFCQLNTCGYSSYVTSYLARGRLCRLQLLLILASAVVLGSESRGTGDHILLSQIRDSPNLEGQIPVFISPRNRVAQLYPRHWVPFFVSYDSQGYGGGIWPHLYWLNQSQSQSQSYVTTDGQSASLSWCQAPVWGLTTRFLFLSDSCLFVDVGRSLSDERTGLPFTNAAGPRQRSHSWARVPRDSWPYFTVSDSRLPRTGGSGPRVDISQEQGGPVIIPWHGPLTKYPPLL
jgi:hypothetical protein